MTAVMNVLAALVFVTTVVCAGLTIVRKKMEKEIRALREEQK